VIYGSGVDFPMTILHVQAVVPSQVLKSGFRHNIPWQHGLVGEHAWPPWPQEDAWHVPADWPGGMTQLVPEQQSAEMVQAAP
jgi:hypothetical protein